MYTPRPGVPEVFATSTDELPSYTVYPSYGGNDFDTSTQYFQDELPAPHGFPTDKPPPLPPRPRSAMAVVEGSHARGKSLHEEQLELNARLEKMAIAISAAEIAPSSTEASLIPPYDIKPGPSSDFEIIPRPSSACEIKATAAVYEVPSAPVAPSPFLAPPDYLAPPTVSPPALPPRPRPQPAHTFPLANEQHNSAMRRFLGDTLIGRFARASAQSAVSTVRMHSVLSPWGDNNPVTLPNVRYRDAALFAVSTAIGGPLLDGIDSGVTDLFGAHSFAAEVTGAVAESAILQTLVLEGVETALEAYVIEPTLPADVTRLIITTAVATLVATLKHKLMGVTADLRFWEPREALAPKDPAKGWLCPLLFASARTPVVPRALDFAIAACYGPGLAADRELAAALLRHAPIGLGMCPADPATEIEGPRLLVALVAIAPFRGGVWSSSRRPGTAVVRFGIPNGCPALVIPVVSGAPVCAWSPWTLAQMTGDGGYNARRQREEICGWLEEIMDWRRVEERWRGREVEVLSWCVDLLIKGAQGIPDASEEVRKQVDLDRAGIAMFRY